MSTGYINLTSRKFGRLFVLSHGTSTSQYLYWLCRCDCGSITEVRTADLKNGSAKSCGCLMRDLARDRVTTHGQSRSRNGKTATRTYKAWAAMHSRCHAIWPATARRYKDRGITVCSAWKDFSVFLADMGECPPSLTLDRINGDLGYSKDNCRWATCSEQRRNQRKTNHD